MRVLYAATSATGPATIAAAVGQAELRGIRTTTIVACGAFEALDGMVAWAEASGIRSTVAGPRDCATLPALVDAIVVLDGEHPRTLDWLAMAEEHGLPCYTFDPSLREPHFAPHSMANMLSL